MGTRLLTKRLSMSTPFTSIERQRHGNSRTSSIRKKCEQSWLLSNATTPWQSAQKASLSIRSWRAAPKRGKSSCCAMCPDRFLRGMCWLSWAHPAQEKRHCSICSPSNPGAGKLQDTSHSTDIHSPQSCTPSTAPSSRSRICCGRSSLAVITFATRLICIALRSRTPNARRRSTICLRQPASQVVSTPRRATCSSAACRAARSGASRSRARSPSDHPSSFWTSQPRASTRRRRPK
mmetsp:Transcript_24920/g.68330  ORF Transcript_24920/g.68330 Transcript_24920/m.68330 type:complete len:235 (+) Transcript_24920:1703-2407(+)